MNAMTLKRHSLDTVSTTLIPAQSDRSAPALMIRSAVCMLSMFFALMPLLAQEAKRNAEPKPAQQPESPAQTGKSDSKPADPELMSAVYFLDPADQSLKSLPKEHAKVVNKHSGFSSNNGFIQIPGAASPFRLKSGHDLVFVVKCTNPESYELYPFQKHTDKRETLVSKAKFGGFAGAKVTTQKMGSIEISTSKYGEMSYRFVVKALEPGEYGFPVQWEVYNFGVDPN